MNWIASVIFAVIGGGLVIGSCWIAYRLAIRCGTFGRIFGTLLVIATCLALIVAWQSKQSLFATRSNYLDPAIEAERERLRSLATPTEGELYEAKLKAKKQIEGDRHNQALDSFDETMKKEAEKIKNRSESTTAPSTERTTQ